MANVQQSGCSGWINTAWVTRINTNDLVVELALLVVNTINKKHHRVPSSLHPRNLSFEFTLPRKSWRQTTKWNALSKLVKIVSNIWNTANTQINTISNKCLVVFRHFNTELYFICIISYEHLLGIVAFFSEYMFVIVLDCSVIWHKCSTSRSFIYKLVCNMWFSWGKAKITQCIRELFLETVCLWFMFANYSDFEWGTLLLKRWKCCRSNKEEFNNRLYCDKCPIVW